MSKLSYKQKKSVEFDTSSMCLKCVGAWYVLHTGTHHLWGMSKLHKKMKKIKCHFRPIPQCIIFANSCLIAFTWPFCFRYWSIRSQKERILYHTHYVHFSNFVWRNVCCTSKYWISYLITVTGLSSYCPYCCCRNWQGFKIRNKHRCTGWHSCRGNCLCSDIICNCYPSYIENQNERLPYCFKATSGWVL